MRILPFAPWLALGLALSAEVLAQEYPVKPVTLVIPFAPGGGTDMVARPVAVG